MEQPAPQYQPPHYGAPAHYGDQQQPGSSMNDAAPPQYPQYPANSQPYQQQNQQPYQQTYQQPSDSGSQYPSIPAQQQPYASGPQPYQVPQQPQAPYVPPQAAPGQYPAAPPMPQGAPQVPPYAPPQQYPQQPFAQSPQQPYAQPQVPPQQPQPPYPGVPQQPPQQPWAQPQPQVPPQPYPQAPQAYQQPYQSGPAQAPVQPDPSAQSYPPAQQYPAQPAPPQQFAPAPQLPAQQQYPVQQNPVQNPQGSMQGPGDQPPAMDFPPPPNLAPVRDNFLNGAGPFLEPGEQVYYGFVLKLDDTIEETPRELMIAIEGQHHTLGEINRTSRKINRGMKWIANPLDAATEKFGEKSVEALNRKMAGPVFIGGWMSQAGWFIRYARATREDYGPGSFGAITSRRYMIFRAGRMGGSAMRLVYAVPRTAIAGVRIEGSKDALMHGRTPRAELHFTDGSMVATMMPTKSGEQLATILQVQAQGRF